MQRRRALESAAAHGGVRCGLLPAQRLRAVLLGDAPSDTERARVHRASPETPLDRLAMLAREIPLPFEALDKRFSDLFGSGLEDAQPWTLGALIRRAVARPGRSDVEQFPLDRTTLSQSRETIREKPSGNLYGSVRLAAVPGGQAPTVKTPVVTRAMS